GWNVLTADQIRARNPFSFWAPLDAYFLQIMVNLSYYTQMLFLSPEGPQYFNAYLTYDTTTANLTPAQILAQEATASNTAAQNATVTSTAVSYYQSLVSPPDTIVPSTPTILTEVSGTPTQASLTWSASTANAGVLGYSV